MTTTSREPVEHPSRHARDRPDAIAVLDAGSGAHRTYAELEDTSRGFAHQLRAWGVEPGDHVAMVLTNRPEFLEIAWAAHRLGTYYTAVDPRLRPAEAAAVVTACGARVVVVDADLPELVTALRDALPHVERWVTVGDPGSYAPPAGTDDLSDEREGEKMLFSSGTTGAPKGVARPLTGGPPGSVFLVRPLMRSMGFDADSVLISPAPLHHAAPLGYAMGVHRLGGTVVTMPRFDPAGCLAAIERHRASHGLFVPTMFVRMLALPDRERFDTSSLRVAVHGAAPCPVDVKRAMIDWWGPVLHEYYAGTEGAGMTLIDTHEWERRPGSVGRPVAGAVHVVDPETGDDLPAGRTGAVWFSGGAGFAYHGDPAATAAAHDGRGRTTMGDLGYVDDDGYLFLTGRAGLRVISGGVNLEPREAEDLLRGHPEVADVAVFGVPDPDLGERLVALVVATPGAGPDPAAVLAWCRERLSGHRSPRELRLRAELPRGETGKLRRQALQQSWTEET